MKLGRFALVGAILATSVGCDQVTKIAARQHLEGQGTQSFLGDTFRLTYTENYGAFLGMGSNLPDPVRNLIFVGLVSIFLVGFLVWILRTRELSRTALVSATLIIGGGIGNLIDRVLFDGGVTDFMNLGIGPVRTGIFNVADVWIVVGAAALLLLSPEARRGFRVNEDEGD